MFKFKKIIASILVATMLPITPVAEVRIFAANNIDYVQDYDLDDEEYAKNRNSGQLLFDSINYLSYDGDSRVINNLRYNYVDGKLNNVVDVYDNKAEYFMIARAIYQKYILTEM